MDSGRTLLVEITAGSRDMWDDAETSGAPDSRGGGAPGQAGRGPGGCRRRGRQLRTRSVRLSREGGAAVAGCTPGQGAGGEPA